MWWLPVMRASCQSRVRRTWHIRRPETASLRPILGADHPPARRLDVRARLGDVRRDPLAKLFAMRRDPSFRRFAEALCEFIQRLGLGDAAGKVRHDRREPARLLGGDNRRESDPEI